IGIGDAHIGRQRQRRMSGGAVVGREDLAIGGAAAVEIGAIPGSGAGRRIVRIVLRHIGLAAHRLWLADLLAPPPTWWTASGGHSGRPGDAIFLGGEGAALPRCGRPADGGAGGVYGEKKGRKSNYTDGAALGGRHGTQHSTTPETFPLMDIPPAPAF